MGGWCTWCMLLCSVSCTQCQLMLMTWGDKEGYLNFVFCDDGRVVDKKGKCRIKIGMIWRVQGYMSSQGHDLPDWVLMTSYRCLYRVDQKSFLPSWEWFIDLNMKLSLVQVSHKDFPISSHLSLSLPLPQNMKSCYPYLSLHALIIS